MGLINDIRDRKEAAFLADELRKYARDSKYGSVSFVNEVITAEFNKKKVRYRIEMERNAKVIYIIKQFVDSEYGYEYYKVIPGPYLRINTMKDILVAQPWIFY